ncbi:MAG: hypothetical protein NZ899_13435, partial [Thermoguttaceae bacterium]|nr:hypothetical protein [Thermoguttaceae bacterium]
MHSLLPVNRRHSLKLLAVGTVAGELFGGRWSGVAGEPLSAEPKPISVAKDLPLLGRLKTRRSAEIQTSPLSVGFEVLDRRLFDPAKTYPYLGELGVKWARCQTGWCRCEERPGEYQFG